ncbi:hypothetical protein SNE40_013026 [Patella caerulea]|uniref:Uncharacterized protein n=1 Tax=Patella caerulea TaxID=87958 RepID=A0AAN8JHB3_PATCE
MNLNVSASLNGNFKDTFQNKDTIDRPRNNGSPAVTHTYKVYNPMATEVKPGNTSSLPAVVEHTPGISRHAIPIITQKTTVSKKLCLCKKSITKTAVSKPVTRSSKLHSTCSKPPVIKPKITQSSTKVDELQDIISSLKLKLESAECY